MNQELTKWAAAASASRFMARSSLPQLGRSEGAWCFAGVKKASPGAIKRYPQIVEHFARIARANFGNVVGIDDLCRLARANPRTISRAFKVVHGTTPSRYLRELRLIEVRRVLLSGRNRASITQVAMRFGFSELGRFSALYRKKFEEAPSVTKICPNLDMSRTTPGKGRAGWISLMSTVRQWSKVRLATPQTTIPSIRAKDEYLQSDKRPVFRAPQRH